MSWPTIVILVATSGYFVAAGLYAFGTDWKRAAIFGMYGACNLLIASIEAA